MRTKLDTIVEEEQRRPFSAPATVEWFPPGTAKRIAERAFRHGDEQSKAAAYVDKVKRGDRYNSLSVEVAWHDVQPAPAGEKCPRCLHPEDTYAPHKCGVWAAWRDDRRSGKERRKDKCACGHRLHPGYVCNVAESGKGLCECCAGWLPSWMDCRSGQDRRRG